MGKMRTWVVLAIVIFCSVSLAAAETIFLKSGQKVQGRVTERTNDYVKVDFDGVELTYYNDEINTIVQDNSPGTKEVYNQLQALYKAYTASQAPAPVKQEKEEVQPAEASVVPKQEAAQEEPAPPADLSRMLADLSQFPPEYQEIIKANLAKMQPESAGKAAKQQPESSY